jgi:ABC-type Fe3+/spermidine/putrescine transport system ATPase subunit
LSISVNNLTKVFGRSRVVDGVSFEVAEGEFVSLLGPSGCGKSTTLRCIAGLEEMAAGSVSIDGKTVSEPERGILVPPHERDIGMVFQSYAVWPHMTVAENVGFPLSVRRAPAKVIKERVDWALGVVGLTGLSDRHPSQLSGGQQQRVALARAIVGRPRVLLFDEPLSNLDAKLRDQMRAEIRRLQRELGIAALYVTHDQAEALSMSDRVIVMDLGRIMQEGAPKDLYRRPANRFVADFVGVASFIDATPVGDGRTWRLPDGSTVVASDGPANAPRGCQLVLRPESVIIAEAGAPPQIAGSDVQTLPGRVREVHYLGPYSEYVVEAGGGLIRVHSEQDIPAGSDVAVSFRSADARILAND